MNETQLWYCDVCKKTHKIKNKSAHINYKTHKHKEKYGFVVKEYEFIKPDIDEVNNILGDTIKGCRRNIFLHSNKGVYTTSN